MCEAATVREVLGDRCFAASLASTLELRLGSATVVASPEWRLGDMARALVQGPASLVQEVFVELQLGKRKFSSKGCPLQLEGDSLAFNFNQEVLRIAHDNEPEMQVRLYAKRGVQSALRGHPLIGEGRLTLGADQAPHQAEVLLERRGAAAGTLSLDYRFSMPGLLEELLGRIRGASEEVEWRRAAELLFEHLDQDKNGALEGQEYQDVMDALTAYVGARYEETWGKRGVAFCEEDVRTSVQWDMDVDFDGVVTKEEFMTNLREILKRSD